MSIGAFVMDDHTISRLADLGNAFTPGSPVNNQDLFAGRIDQLSKIFSAVTQRGYHVVLYGERGVGKTSLANMVARGMGTSPRHLIAKVTCDAGDNFSSVWHKVFKEITYTTQRAGIGFTAPTTAQVTALADCFPTVANPDDVRRVLESIGADRSVVIILDEYDRVLDRLASTLISDTIKVLSDNGTDVTLLLIGVANSVSDLIGGHQSIERALVQIPMPRMSNDEIGQIIDKGMSLLDMTVEQAARTKIVKLSQGVPYVAHLIGLHSAKAAIISGASKLTHDSVRHGISASLDQWHESIKRSYYAATKSHQPGNIYKEVLLACALGEVDELGYFTAASVRHPLRQITGRDYDIPNFAAHLKHFSETTRGSVLVREGQQRRWRYRFTSPLMRPYIVMRGYEDGLTKDSVA
jgi:Cdc6-like AAA superfamily ATPase